MFPSASSLTRGATVVLASASSTPCTSLLFCCWFVLVGDPLSASWLFAVLVSPAGSLFLKWTDETVTLSFKYFKENCYRSHKLLNNRPFQVFKKVLMRIVWWKSVDTAEKSDLMLANLPSLKVIHLKEAKIHSIPPKLQKLYRRL